MIDRATNMMRAMLERPDARNFFVKVPQRRSLEVQKILIDKLGFEWYGSGTRYETRQDDVCILIHDEGILSFISMAAFRECKKASVTDLTLTGAIFYVELTILELRKTAFRVNLPDEALKKHEDAALRRKCMFGAMRFVIKRPRI